MSEDHGTSDGLWRWLAGGLVAGGIVLGLLIGAYEIGYHRGKDRVAAAPAKTTTTATTTAATTAPATTTPKPAAVTTVPATPELVARGKALYTADACSGCHSLTGSAGAGPSFKGLAGSKAELATGASVTADDAYLVRAITDPDAEIAKGYNAGIMGPAIANFGLDTKPDDVRALVAFIKSVK